VVAGDDKAGAVHELFQMRSRCFMYRVELVQPENETFFGWAMISLKFTVN
jgi:hypothetical protein